MHVFYNLLKTIASLLHNKSVSSLETFIFQPSHICLKITFSFFEKSPLICLLYFINLIHLLFQQPTMTPPPSIAFHAPFIAYYTTRSMPPSI